MNEEDNVITFVRIVDFACYYCRQNQILVIIDLKIKMEIETHLHYNPDFYYLRRDYLSQDSVEMIKIRSDFIESHDSPN
jgi:hypothetical protein